jgi:hypothetical protein
MLYPLGFTNPASRVADPEAEGNEALEGPGPGKQKRKICENGDCPLGAPAPLPALLPFGFGISGE